jgi:hypothetical protein
MQEGHAQRLWSTVRHGTVYGSVAKLMRDFDGWNQPQLVAQQPKAKAQLAVFDSVPDQPVIKTTVF